MGAIKVETYRELNHYVGAFKERDIELLCVIGKPGAGKSRYIASLLRDTDYEFFNAHATPLEIYKRAYEARGRLLIFDDVNGLTFNRDSMALLRQLAETEKNKTVCWASTTKKLGDVPQQFVTSSRVCIIANYLKAPDPITMGLFDRGILLEFEPTAEELLGYAKEHLGAMDNEHSKEVMSLIERYRPFAKEFSLRLIRKALDLYGRLSREEYIKFLVSTMGVNEEAAYFVELMSNRPQEAVKRWKERYPERTFYQYKKAYDNYIKI